MPDAFRGVIGRPYWESTPDWPEPPRAPNVLLVVLADVGFAQLGCCGGARPSATRCCRSTAARCPSWCSSGRRWCRRCARYVYYPGSHSIPQVVAVNVRNRSHLIEAEVDGDADRDAQAKYAQRWRRSSAAHRADDTAARGTRRSARASRSWRAVNERTRNADSETPRPATARHHATSASALPGPSPPSHDEPASTIVAAIDPTP